MYNQYKASSEVIEKYLRAMEHMEAAKRYADAKPEKYAELAGLDPEDQFKGKPHKRAKQLSECLREVRWSKLRFNRKAAKSCKWWRKEGGAIKRFLAKTLGKPKAAHQTEYSKYFELVTTLQLKHEQGDQTAGMLLRKMGEVTSVV